MLKLGWSWSSSNKRSNGTPFLRLVSPTQTTTPGREILSFAININQNFPKFKSRNKTQQNAFFLQRNFGFDGLHIPPHCFCGYFLYFVNSFLLCGLVLPRSLECFFCDIEGKNKLVSSAQEAGRRYVMLTSPRTTVTWGAPC